MTVRIGFIVEGKFDKRVVSKAFPDATVVVTNGNGFSKRVRAKIIRLVNSHDVVVCLSDPDDAGDILAKKIIEMFPTVLRVRVPEERARILQNRGYKHGIEYCSPAFLKDYVYKSLIESLLEEVVQVKPK